MFLFATFELQFFCKSIIQILFPWISICFAASFLSLKNFNFYILSKWASLDILLYMYGFLAWSLLWGKFEGFFFFIYVLDMIVMYFFALWSSLNEMSFVFCSSFCFAKCVEVVFLPCCFDCQLCRCYKIVYCYLLVNQHQAFQTTFFAY